MDREQVNELMLNESILGSSRRPELVETHISWVILTDHFVYKIKKPISYSFLDFSTIEKRKYYCLREVELNKRLADNIYLDVQPVMKTADGIMPGGDAGEVIDYLVRMNKVDRHRQMDILLLNNTITNVHIKMLAEKIAAFHKNADIVLNKNIFKVVDEFNDLGVEVNFLVKNLGAAYGAIINRAINVSAAFIEKNRELLSKRFKDGFFKDCHGDLHSRNIFFLTSPQPFDCIEFNDDFRQIDVINEIAFLCMDLDAFGRKDLANEFLRCYNSLFPAIRTVEENLLFVYYKSYRANIRAKVNSLRFRDVVSDEQKKIALDEVVKYLHLMNSYIDLLDV